MASHSTDLQDVADSDSARSRASPCPKYLRKSATTTANPLPNQSRNSRAYTNCAIFRPYRRGGVARDLPQYGRMALLDRICHVGWHDCRERTSMALPSGRPCSLPRQQRFSSDPRSVRKVARTDATHVDRAIRPAVP